MVIYVCILPLCFVFFNTQQSKARCCPWKIIIYKKEFEVWTELFKPSHRALLKELDRRVRPKSCSNKDYALCQELVAKTSSTKMRKGIVSYKKTGIESNFFCNECGNNFIQYYNEFHMFTLFKRLRKVQLYRTCLLFLFNDDHVLQLRTETVAIRGRMRNDFGWLCWPNVA